MIKFYVIGISRDGRGAIVHWSQMATSREHAQEVAAEWETAGIKDVQIIEK